MKIEVGKRYVTRGGKISEPVQYADADLLYSAEHRFAAMVGLPHSTTFMANGREFHDMETAFDLVAEYKEQDVSYKADKLNKLIDEMPVCGDGKSKIRALVQEMTGEKLVKPKPKAGEVWSNGSESLLIVDSCGGIDLGNVPLRSASYIGGLEGSELLEYLEDGFKKVASSLKEYVANGGKL